MHKRVWVGLLLFVLAVTSLLDIAKTPEQRMNDEIERRTPIVGELQAKAEVVRTIVNAPKFYNPDPAASIIGALVCVGLGAWAMASAAKRSAKS